MADTIVALLGPVEGPPVYIGNYPAPKLEVIKGCNGQVEVEYATQERPQVFKGSGIFNLDKDIYVKVKYSGPDKNVICKIHSR